MKKIVNNQVIVGIDDLFSKLNPMDRWGSIIYDPSYNQLTKQTMNCITTFFLAKQYEKETGKKLDWTKFPKITLFRAFKNVFATADVPSSIIKRTLDKAGLDETAIDNFAFAKMAENTTEEFAEFIRLGRGGIEEKIYNASSKIATYVELSGIPTTDEQFKEHKKEDIMREIWEYIDIPGIKEMMGSKMLESLKKISKLRYQNRWSTYFKLVKCSVLGHLFDTAVFSYLIVLEETNNEKKAAKAFFLGLFHDLAELLTKDMPSTTKDGILDYRKASENVEEELLEEELYPFLPKYHANNLRKMNYETPKNAAFKPFVKGADYLSAASEIYRQVKAGTRYPDYLEALLGHERKFISKAAVLSPSCRELYREICEVSYKILVQYLLPTKKETVDLLMDSVRNS